MAVIKCKMCGGDLAFEEGSTVCECEYCGSRQTIPNIGNEKKANLFNRANHLRMNCEFDKAIALYESIAAEFPEEAEAYWGLCLCNYGIEYVDDPATGKKLPTCHRTMTSSIMEDANFEQACDYADSIARKVYRDEAKAIDRIQKDMNRQNYPAAITAFHELGAYQESTTNLRTCIDAYCPQLQAEKVKKTSADPKLKAAQDKVSNIEQHIQKLKRTIEEAKTSKVELDQREKAKSAEIQRLSQELGQVRGLFSGGKKRELETKIEALKRELSDISRQKEENSATAEKTQWQLTGLVNELASAKAYLKKEEENVAAAALTEWTDDAIVSAAAAVPHEAAIAPFKKVGNYVTFGHYKQDYNRDNGKKDVEWLVLDVQGDKVLLVSRYALDCRPYNTTNTSVTWETCYLRTWLNGTFINEAFTTEEQKAVLTTTVDNSYSQGFWGYSTDGGNNTQDKVFLLSYAEAWKYFQNDDARECQPTGYAVARNAYVASNCTCKWWLRSPGSSSSSAAVVRCNGAHYYYNVSFDGGAYGGNAVRPAFWLDLSSDIF